MVTQDFRMLKIFIICLANIQPVFSVAEVDLFPHEESDGSTLFRFDDDGQQAVSLSSPFAIFNKTYQSVMISGNGVLGLGSNAIPRITGSATCRIIGRKNYQVIMGLFFDAYEGIGSTLTYMETAEATHLQKARNDIATAFPQFDTGSGADLSWMFIVTWKDIGPCCVNSTTTRNTFQLILTKSESHSFVLLYYTKIQWSGSEDWAAGFDMGTFPPVYLLPGSCTSEYQLLTNSSNIGEGEESKGKWVFGVESNLILPGMELQKEPQLAKQEQVLLIQPNVISVIGNVPMFIQWPNLENDININNISIACLFRDPSLTRPSETTGAVLANCTVICPVPFLYSLGRMEINVLVKYQSDSNPTLYRGDIYVVREHEVDILPQIHINTSTENIPTLTATWLKSSTEIKFLNNIARQSNSFPDSIEIVLLEFKRNIWKEVGPVTTKIANNGNYTSPVNMTTFKELTKLSAGEPTLHMLAIKANYILEESGATIHKLLPSLTPIPTEMITLNKLETVSNKSDGNIYDGFCKSWHEKESCPSTNMNTLPCPKTLNQAEHDWRFYPESKLLYPPVVVSSFMQKVPSPTGAASQCNYDIRGNLLIGIPGAAHLFRNSPNSRKDYWKHYLEDIMPFLYCCQWGELREANCPSFYYQKRPSVHGVNYSVPRPSRATGLAHVTTFDERNFTLVGAGEVWLIKYSSNDRFQKSEFRMQARIEPYHSPISNNTFDNASIVTAVAMEDMSNDNQVKVQVSYVPTPGHISVMVDGHLVNGTGGFNFYHDGVTIRFRYSTRLVVSFSSGFSVQFWASPRNGSYLSIVVSADSHLIERTKGILGNADTDTAPGDPGANWRVQENESMFSYPSGESYADYNNKVDFNPPKILMNGPSPDQEVAHDMNLVQTTHIVIAGIKAYEEYYWILDTANSIVNQCELPDDLENGRFLVNSLGVGSNITLSCDPGYFSYSELANESFVCGHKNENDVTESTSTEAKPVGWINVDTNEEMPSFSCLPEEVGPQDAEVIEYESSTSTEDWVTEDAVGGIGLGAEQDIESSCLIFYDNAFLWVLIGIAIVVAAILITIFVTLMCLYVGGGNKYGFVNGISISPGRENIVEEIEL